MILKMPGTAPPYWRLAIHTNPLRNPRARSGSRVSIRATALPPFLLKKRQNISAELFSGSRVTHPRIKDEPGIRDAFRCLAEQRLRVERVPVARDDKRGGRDLAEAVLEVVLIFRLDGHHEIRRVLWRRQQPQQERCEPDDRPGQVFHEPLIGEQGAEQNGDSLHPSALLCQASYAHLQTSSLVAQGVGARMNDQPADQIRVVGGEVLGDGAPRRDADHVNRPPEFLADHPSVIVPHVFHSEASGHTWPAEHLVYRVLLFQELVEPNKPYHQSRLRFVLE